MKILSAILAVSLYALETQRKRMKRRGTKPITVDGEDVTNADLCKEFGGELKDEGDKTLCIDDDDDCVAATGYTALDSENVDYNANEC